MLTVPLLANLCNACGLRYKEGAALERDPATALLIGGSAVGGQPCKRPRRDR